MKTKPKRGKQSPKTTAPPRPTPVSEQNLHRIALVVLFLLPLVFYAKYLFGGQMLFGTDWLGAGGYQMREFMARYISSHGNIAFWMPAILSGQPTVAAFFGDLFYPTQLFRLFIPVHVVWAWTFYLHVFVAGLGTYLFLKELKLPVLPAALGGVAYMFAGSLLTLTYAGHDGRLIGCALVPFALFFLHRGMNRRQLFYFLLCGLIVALQLLSGHVQKVYYTVLILFAWFLFVWIRTIRAERSAALAVKLAAFFGIGMGLALALSAIQYLPIIGNMSLAARGSERGYAYATSWSMPIRETLDLISPSFSGILNDYHGTNPFKLHSEYMGLIPLIFAVWAVVRAWKNPRVKFFLLAFAVTLLMAWGGNTPFYRIPYHILPGISKFRGPGMIFFLASFSIAVLAAFGFQQAMRWTGRKKWHRPRTPVVLAVALAVVMTVDIGLSLRLWNKKEGFIRGVPPPAQYFSEDEAIAFLKKDTTLYRVMPMNYERSDAGVLMGHGIQSVGGQLPNPLQSYQDFIGSGSSVMFQSGNLENPNLMNLLNIKYVISLTLPEDASRYDPKSRQVIRHLRHLFAQPRFEPAHIGTRYTVHRNLGVLPRAFLVPGYELMDTREQLLEKLKRPDFDPAAIALLYDDPGFTPASVMNDSGDVGSVRVVKHNANEIVLRTDASTSCLLVLSENYHPDWKAYVDDRRTTVLRAYHTLRAIPLEPGRHEVSFRHESTHFRTGTLISILALAFLAAVAVVTVARRKNRNK